MTDHLDRVKSYEELVQRVAAAVRAIQLYAADHPVIERTLGALEEAIRLLHAHVPVATFGLLSGSVVGGDLPLTRVSSGLREFIGRLESRGMERIAIERGVTRNEIIAFLKAVVARGAEAARLRVDSYTALALPHIRAGRLHVASGVAGADGGMGTARQMYGKAVESAQAVWESASTEQQPRHLGRPQHNRGPRRGAHDQSRGRARPHGHEALRQLHVHAHGQRRDPDDGTGPRAGDRGPAPARLRPRGPDARSRQGPDTGRNPHQAGAVDRGGVRDHEAARHRRRRDPPAHAGNARARPCSRLRTPPAARRHGVSRARPPHDAESRHAALRHRRRLRRHALETGVPAVVSDRAHHGGLQRP